MNPNFDSNQSQDAEPDPNAPGEGTENEMQFSTADYPELDGLQQGAPVKVTCDATVGQSGNGSVSLNITPGSCQFQVEGQADKAMKEMSQQSAPPPPPSGNEGDSF